MRLAERSDEVRRLVDRLRLRWTDGNAQMLVQHLAAALECDHPIGPNLAGVAVQFQLDLSKVYLNGLGDRVGCLVVGGEGTETEQALRGCWQKYAATGSLMLSFCTEEAAYAAARRLLPRRYALVLSPEEILDLFGAERPRRRLVEALRARVGLRFLSVYSICLPAGTAFFGRSRELSRLLEDARTSFAVTGPGRIGKSSLIKRHVWNLRRNNDPRAARLVEVDCSPLARSDPDAMARAIATKIRANPRSQRVTAPDLVQFLRENRPAGGPVELLLDETDEVCASEAFCQLGQAAKEGLVRLILCGRKGLHDFAVRERSPMARRLVTLRIGPLTEADARDLICLPLDDLGIAAADPSVIRRLIDETGKLPHIIQFYCKHLVDLAVERGVRRIDHALIDELEGEYEFLETFVSPLLELKDSHILGLAADLLRADGEPIRLGDVAELANRRGLDLSLREVQDVCDELVIQNILAWDRRAYRIANPALRRFAVQIGLLS